jgi:hypothetical protein
MKGERWISIGACVAVVLVLGGIVLSAERDHRSEIASRAEVERQMFLLGVQTGSMVIWQSLSTGRRVPTGDELEAEAWKLHLSASLPKTP